MGTPFGALVAGTLRTLALLLVWSSLGAAEQEGFPRGQVIPKVTCQAAPEYSYALYLPKGYQRDRAAPVLFGFSPGGMGREPVDLFAAAADRFGFIVVGSHDVRNGAIQPNIKAQDALWKDVHDRFQVQARRCYSVGFSGGARMALRMAEDHASAFAGVISFGAFGTGRDPRGMGHVDQVLACGAEDFNHWELLRGTASLRSQSLKVMADRFPDGHQWAPEAFCLESLAFLQLRALARGLIPEEAGLQAWFLARRQLAAEAAEAQGDLLLAQRRWEDLASSFPSTPEGLAAGKHMARLARSPSLKTERDLEAKYELRRPEIERLQGSSHYGKALLQLHGQLLQVSRAEATNIRRVLSREAMKFQAEALAAMRAKDWDRAAGLLSTQASFQDKEPWPCLYLAAVRCQLGRPEEAMEQLREGRRRGYHQAQTLRDSPLLLSLRGRADFEQLLEEMSRPNTPPEKTP